MKIRNGFVSNSSSSSFIVVKDGKYNNDKINSSVYKIGKSGEHRFGSTEDCIYSETDAKINFAWMQIMYIKHIDMNLYNKWSSMLDSAIKKHFSVADVCSDIVIDIDSDSCTDCSYIDHKSNATRGKCVDMFNSQEELETFLFSEKSYIDWSYNE